MPLARKHQIIPGQPGFYHCVSRCVRRAWLCGRDPLTGRCYDHRRAWLIERMRVLTTCFAIDVYAYSVMSNHCHVVLYVDPARLDELSNEEIARRWKVLWNWREPDREISIPKSVPAETLREWRSRLGDISWFMRMLNEPIARIANAEDECKGHFWESRFQSIPLLDESAVLACMTYVDLNPIKAGIATSAEDSDYTSIQERIHGLSADDDEGEGALSPVCGGDSSRSDGLVRFPGPGIDTVSYIKLIDDTAVSLGSEATFQFASKLNRLNLNEAGWIASAQHFLDLFRSAAGGTAAFEAFMEMTGRKRRQDASGRRILYS